MISIINYGGGNIKSVYNALNFLGYEAKIINDHNELKKSSVIILPGVGAFNECKNNLDRLKITEILNQKVVTEKTPFLGICIGLQLLGEKSFENIEKNGFGWISGEVVKLKKTNNIRLPHMGWNNIKIKHFEGLYKDFHSDPTFYFVHNYYLNANKEYVTATCNHGIDFPVSIQKDNIYSVQFHPEKSQDNGFKLLNNFFDEINY